MPGVDDTQEVVNEEEAQTDQTQSENDSIPFVVGTGASAGGIEAFCALLEALPSDTGMAFIQLHLRSWKRPVEYPRVSSASRRNPPTGDILQRL